MLHRPAVVLRPTTRSRSALRHVQGRDSAAPLAEPESQLALLVCPGDALDLDDVQLAVDGPAGVRPQPKSGRSKKRETAVTATGAAGGVAGGETARRTIARAARRRPDDD